VPTVPRPRVGEAIGDKLRRVASKLPTAKKVSYQAIEPDSPAGKPIYRMLNDLVSKHHEEIKDARILVAWNLAWRPDVDGRVTLGKCKKASYLDRELAPYDFVILLRKEFFEDAAVSDEQRLALLDHELCHATVKLDSKTLEPVIDVKGRKVWRTVKHDIEEFSAVVSRHGLYKRDLERFFRAVKVKQLEMFEPHVPPRGVDTAQDFLPKPAAEEAPSEK
jgi:hypothetical protein